MHLVPTLAGIAWDPQIRGILSVLVGVVVLMGSVYLLLATNVASRLGFLLALAAIFGWMTIRTRRRSSGDCSGCGTTRCWFARTRRSRRRRSS